jgi:hypothetical protein
MTDNRIHPKSVKKVKKFFQIEQSLKTRVDALIKLANEDDQFLKQNHSSAIQLIRDYVDHKCLKLRGN